MLTSDLLAFDIASFAKANALTKSAYSSWGWTWTNGRKASIIYRIIPGEGVRLTYTVGKTEDFDYLVRVATTSCNYGGVRYWWLCPKCERRCRVLYGGRLFVCWKCSGAYYETQQSKSLAIRIRAELHRIRRRLGFNGDVVPPKPKGMHWRTYAQLTKRFTHLLEAWEMAKMFDLLESAQRLGIPTSYDPGMKNHLRYFLKHLG